MLYLSPTGPGSGLHLDLNLDVACRREVRVLHQMQESAIVGPRTLLTLNFIVGQVHMIIVDFEVRDSQVTPGVNQP